jgi:riboflavin biosynthesis pyrimidine reductase
VSLRALEAAGPPLGADEVIAALGLRDRPQPDGRPRVVAAMIGSLDGRAAVAGRSVGLGHPDDRALLRGLRAGADAVLVGAATVRAERYATLFDGPERPLVAVVSRSGAVPWEVGMFAEPDMRIAVYGADAAPETAAAVALRPERALAEIVASLPGGLVLCEGGPTLLAALVAERLLDDLVLTVAPLLAAGDAPTALAGPAFDPPPRLELAGAWRSDDHVFLHYTT